jgi:hypothetical protein
MGRGNVPMNDAPPPTIGPSITELPDPRGPINDDFKRGACYVARIANKEWGNAPAVIIITIPGGRFTCEK